MKQKNMSMKTQTLLKRPKPKKTVVKGAISREGPDP